MYIFKMSCTQNIDILNTGYNVVLYDKYANTYNWFYIILLYIILLYNFNSLI